MKTILFVMLLVGSVSVNAFNSDSAFSENTKVLTNLPFGIVIGKTKYDEVESRGECIKKRDLTNCYNCDSRYCATYSMEGKFFVSTSGNGTIDKIVFSGKANNKLPRAWEEMGLVLGKKMGISGIFMALGLSDRLEIRKQIEAKNITVSFDLEGKSMYDSKVWSRENVPVEVTIRKGNYVFDFSVFYKRFSSEEFIKKCYRDKKEKNFRGSGCPFDNSPEEYKKRIKLRNYYA